MICDLVIPARDEEVNIPALFDALDALPAGTIRHLVLADNGSIDTTATLARARGADVVHEPQRGYGAACLRALAHIAEAADPPDAIAFLDADLADDPAALPDVLAPIAAGDAQLVIGSRVRRADPGALNFVQRFGNGLSCTLMRCATGRRHHDLGPLRAVTTPALHRLHMADRTWGWTVEMQMKAALLDIPCCEVDVPYRRRRAGRSKISGTVRGVVTAGSKITSTIFVLWWQRRRIIAADRAAARDGDHAGNRPIDHATDRATDNTTGIDATRTSDRGTDRTVDPTVDRNDGPTANRAADAAGGDT